MLYVANCLCEGAVQEMESSHGRVERGPLCIMIDTQTFPYGEMVLNSRVTAQLGVLPRSIPRQKWWEVCSEGIKLSQVNTH